MRVQRTGTTDDPVRKQRGTCSIDGCDEPHTAKGLCRRHWWLEYGNAIRNERRTAAKEPRVCAFCGGPVPQERRRKGDRSYCSDEHKQAQRKAEGRLNAAVRKSYFKNRYSLTVEEIDEVAANGTCDICGTNEWGGRHNRPHVDHDHSGPVGVFRGFLCQNCNLMIGHGRDNVEILQKAIDYLQRSILTP